MTICQIWKPRFLYTSLVNQMTAKKNCWKEIAKIVDLVQKDHPTAAKSIWEKLPKDFQSKVLQFVLDIAKTDPQVIASTPVVDMDSDFGEFSIGPEKLSELQKTVLEVM